MAPKVICACEECIQKTVFFKGQFIPGDAVSYTTRDRHMKPQRPDLNSEADSSQPQSSQANAPPEQPLGTSSCSNSPKLTQHIELLVDFSSVVQFCCILVIWLHLKAGVSRNTANIILKATQFILATLLHLIQTALTVQLGREIKIPEIQLPQDIRTALSRHFNDHEPKLIRRPCCPNCFTLYTLDNMPEFCAYRESPQSWRCNTELWRQQRLGKDVKSVPKMWYNTQDFRSWLEWFLSQREVEDALESTFSKTAAGPTMYSFQDSPAWADLKHFRTSKYHLTFAIYIDWFNPFTNKIAGAE